MSAHPDVKVVAVNDSCIPLNCTVHQLKYDNVHRQFNGTIAIWDVNGKDLLIVSGNRVQAFHEVLCIVSGEQMSCGVSVGDNFAVAPANCRAVKYWSPWALIRSARPFVLFCTEG